MNISYCFFANATQGIQVKCLASLFRPRSHIEKGVINLQQHFTGIYLKDKCILGITTLRKTQFPHTAKKWRKKRASVYFVINYYFIGQIRTRTKTPNLKLISSTNYCNKLLKRFLNIPADHSLSFSVFLPRKRTLIAHKGHL